MQQPRTIGLDYVDDLIIRTRSFMDDWMRFSQVIAAYPHPGANKPQLEMQFLHLKSKLARDLPVLKDRLGPDCGFGPEALNIISATPSLHSIYTQSEVAVKKLSTEWHRAFITVNENVGAIEDKRRRALDGERVMLGQHTVKLRIRKPLPWREILIYGGAAAALIVTAGGLYIMRNFLGFWAPKQGAGLVVTEEMTDEQRMHVTMQAMQHALDTQDLDGFMAVFSDDYLDEEQRSKTLVRAMLQTYIAANGFGKLTLDLSGAKAYVNGDTGELSPVYVTTESDFLTIKVSGKKTDGRWLITSLGGV